MPELPEVRAHAERLDAEYRGQVLSRFEPLSFSVLKTFDPSPDLAVGRALGAVTNRAKYLILGFDADPGQAPLSFVVHLMQGGRLRPDTSKARRPRGGMARWTFETGQRLLLTEPGTEHRAGVWMVAGDPLAAEPLASLGPDATTVDTGTMAELMAAHSMRLHGFLRRQSIVSGLGRRLANEVCHRARLSPFANTSRLKRDHVAAVVDAIARSVAEGYAFDAGLDAMSRSAQRPSRVHGRAGDECPECGDVVRSVEYRRYTVEYCPTCQTGGKVLADNTTSRFLK
ncbi:MAG TPA: Fpg/Nei family DNA glycosylase [Acidimicrobiales bacterium]|nr:Fpg/Nei family DNA glycosylase [Acidimicrobiales bacterium]